jgi:hypothetical protein
MQRLGFSRKDENDFTVWLREAPRSYIRPNILRGAFEISIDEFKKRAWLPPVLNSPQWILLTCGNSYLSCKRAPKSSDSDLFLALPKDLRRADGVRFIYFHTGQVSYLLGSLFTLVVTTVMLLLLIFRARRQIVLV